LVNTWPHLWSIAPAAAAGSTTGACKQLWLTVMHLCLRPSPIAHPWSTVPAAALRAWLQSRSHAAGG
jgi:hypothetical protein